MVEARDNRRRDNQPANERQTEGKAPEYKRQRGLDRPRLRVKRWRQSQEDKRQRHQRNIQLANKRQPQWWQWRQHCNRKCRALPSWDLVATALVLTAEAAAVLIADDANGGNGSITIVSSVFMQHGAG